jgi:hypothetical protein
MLGYGFGVVSGVGISINGSKVRMVCGGLSILCLVSSSIFFVRNGSGVVIIGPTRSVKAIIGLISYYRVLFQKLYMFKSLKMRGKTQNIVNGKVGVVRLVKFTNEFAMPFVAGLWPSRLKLSRKRVSLIIRSSNVIASTVFSALLLRSVKFNVFTNKGLVHYEHAVSKPKPSKKTKQKR